MSGYDDWKQHDAIYDYQNAAQTLQGKMTVPSWNEQLARLDNRTIQNARTCYKYYNISNIMMHKRNMKQNLTGGNATDTDVYQRLANRLRSGFRSSLELKIFIVKDSLVPWTLNHANGIFCAEPIGEITFRFLSSRI